VARAGIAKGSIYQYFENKLELYRWLVTDEVPRRKRAFIERDGTSLVAASDLRSFLRGAVLSGMRFMLSDPRVARLAEGLLAPTRDPQLRALGRHVREAGHHSFKQLLASHPIRDQIRSDVELDLVLRFLAGVLGVGIRGLVDGHLGLDLDTLLENPAAANVDPTRLEAFVDDTVSLVVDGISARS
jgi:AcrR family transcriptional regulator